MHPPASSISWRDRFGAVLRNNRLAILVEILFIALLVAAPLPSATPFLLLLGWLSLWLRRDGWRKIGMSRPANWPRTLLWAMGLGFGYQAFSIFILVPILQRLTGTTLDLDQFAPLRGNVGLLIVSLIVSWTLAALGEELVFRGYLFNRLADLFGRNRAGWIISLLLSASLFGLAHLYQGPSGVLETFVSGAFFAGLYLAAQRNLWLPILVHGMIDTIGFLLIFAGLYP
jgi:membrane protease YdiL (CAAX protease family)